MFLSLGLYISVATLSQIMIDTLPKMGEHFDRLRQ